MLEGAMDQIKQAMDTIDSYDSELANWPEAAAYCAAIQFYLGNYQQNEDIDDNVTQLTREMNEQANK